MKTPRVWVSLIVMLGAAVVLGQSTKPGDEAAQAKAAFDALFGEPMAKARSSSNFDEALALADDMLRSADTAAGQPALLALLCENAYSLTARQSRGADTAIRAMILLASCQPEKQAACMAKVVAIQQTLYASETGPAKRAAGEKLIEKQVLRANFAAANDDYAAAASACDDALTVAKAIASTRKDTLFYMARLFQARQKSLPALTALKARLKAAPADAGARADIVRLYIVELDNPAKAAAWLNEESDQIYRTYVPAAAQDTGGLADSLCLELGDWYRQHAEKAKPEHRPPLLWRAVRFYEAYLAKHPEADVTHLKAKLAADKIRPQLAKTPMVQLTGEALARPREPAAPAFSRAVLVHKPVLVRGAGAWTIEPKAPRGQLHAAAVSAGGKLLALADSSGTIRIYDHATGALTALLPGHNQAVTQLTWAHGSELLASGDSDGTVCLWSARRSRQLAVMGGHGGGVRAIVWTADDSRLAVAGLKNVNIWARSGKLLGSLPAAEKMPDLAALAWSRSDQLLAADTGQTAVLWRPVAPTAKPVLLHAKANFEGHSVAFNPLNDSQLAVALHSPAFCLWDVRSGGAGGAFTPEVEREHVTALAWSPNAKMILTGQGAHRGRPTFRCWDVAAKKELFAGGVNEPSVRQVAWSPDGKTALVTRAGELAVINAADGSALRTIAGNELALHARPALTADGKGLAWPCSDNTVRFWNPMSGQAGPAAALPAAPRAVAWDPDAKRLLVLTGKLLIVNPADGQVVRTLDGAGYRCAAWSHDGQLVFAGKNGSRTDNESVHADVSVLDPETGAVKMVFSTGLNTIERLCASPDGAVLATASSDYVRLWDLPAIAAAAPLPAQAGAPQRKPARPRGEMSSSSDAGGFNDIAFSPKGPTLAALRGNGALDLWTASETRNLTLSLPGRPSHITWSPSAKTIVLTRLDSRAVFLDAESGALLRHLITLPEYILFLNEGKTLALCYPTQLDLFGAYRRGQLSATFLPLPGKRALAVSFDGHFTGTEGIEKDITFLANTPAGLTMFSPDEFARKFSWRNDRTRVGLSVGSLLPTSMPGGN